MFALEDQAQLIHRQIELEAEAQVLIARGEDAVDLQHKMAALKAQEAEFQQNFEQMLQAKEAELAQKREQMELEEAAGDRDLERRMQAGETTAQERGISLRDNANATNCNQTNWTSHERWPVNNWIVPK